MSRHRRRRKTRQQTLSLWLLRALIVLFILIASLAVGSYVWLRHYLASAELRERIETRLAQQLHADVRLQPLRWDGFQVRSAELSLSQPGQTLQLLRLQTGITPSALLRGTWSVTPSRIGQLQAQLDLRHLKAPAPPVDASPQWTPHADPKDSPSWLPRSFTLHSLCIDDLDATLLSPQGRTTLHGCRAEMQRTSHWNQTQWRLQSGRLQLPLAALPPLELRHANVVHQNSELHLSDSDWRVFDSASLQLFGEAHLNEEKWSLDGMLKDLDCARVLPEDWKQKLSGKLDSEFHVVKSGAAPQLSGQVALRQGHLTALPILDTLAAYADTQRLRSIAIDQAESDVAWSPGNIQLRRLQIHSEGLLRVEGSLELRHQNNSGPYQLSGVLRLGLSPGLLSQIPGAEEDVFSPGERGMIWTTVNIGGTTDDPTEDLSARLLAAASQRMLNHLPQLGITTLQHAGHLLKNAQPVIEKAEELGQRTINEVETTLQHGKKLLNSASDQLLGLPLPTEVIPPQRTEDAPPSSKRK